MGTTERVGVYPGTFNPPTPAHLEIAASARRQHHLDRVDLAVSRIALGKERLERPLFEHRVAVLRAEAEGHDWLQVVVTGARLIAEIARGYDVVVMGADKWAQVNDPEWYETPAARDLAVAQLPTLAIAPRPGYEVPPEHLLDVPSHLAEVSSTAARSGRPELMSLAAARFDEDTGAWTDPDRYERWLSEQC